MMTPGLPVEALHYATRVGRVMSHGDGLYGGVFVSAMYSAAFFESDPRKIVERALLSLPEDSDYAHIIRDVLLWSKQHPDDWKQTWNLLEAKWHHAGSCPDEAGSPFDIQATLNGAYIVEGLIYGKGDFGKTLEITARSGQDSDSDPSNVGGIIGTVLGYKSIPENWKSGVAELADKPFAYTNFSYNEIVASTLRRAILTIERAGGRERESELSVPDEQPQRAEWERWSMGQPVKVIEAKSQEWRWTGDWSRGAPDAEFCGPRFDYRQSSRSGDAAALEIDGPSVAIAGIRSASGGKADVYVDGNWMSEIDFYIRKGTTDTDLWHSNGLHPGRHRIEIRVRGDHNPESTGTVVGIGKAIVYESPLSQ